jgi:hypothetical protein
MALPRDRTRPLLSARFDPLVTRIDVTCAPDLAVDGRFFNPVRYPLDQLLMMQRLATERGAIIHCALVEVAGRVVICPGVSGAGKTTLSRQLVDSPDFRVLSDDRAVIRLRSDGYWAYGTPWPGEGGFAVNRGLPLSGIGFIQHREVASTERLSQSAAIHRAVRVASLPLFDRDAGPGVFDGLADLWGAFTWLLSCLPTPAHGWPCRPWPTAAAFRSTTSASGAEMGEVNRDTSSATPSPPDRPRREPEARSRCARRGRSQLGRAPAVSSDSGPGPRKVALAPARPGRRHAISDRRRGGTPVDGHAGPTSLPGRRITQPSRAVASNKTACNAAELRLGLTQEAGESGRGQRHTRLSQVEESAEAPVASPATLPVDHAH